MSDLFLQVFTSLGDLLHHVKLILCKFLCFSPMNLSVSLIFRTSDPKRVKKNFAFFVHSVNFVLFAGIPLINKTSRWVSQHLFLLTTPLVLIVVFQMLSHVWLCDPVDCNMPGFPVLHHLPEVAQTHVHWVSNAIQPSLPLSSPSPPAFNLSQHQGFFQWVGSLHQVAKYWNFSISPSNEYSGLISFRIDCWISLQSKRLSRVFSNTTVQKLNSSMLSLLSHPYMTTGKTIALTRLTFIGKVMFLLFNMLSRFVIAFIPRSKHLLISWLQSPSAVILEPKKIKCYCFHCFPICLPWSDGTRCHDFQFLIIDF